MSIIKKLSRNLFLAKINRDFNKPYILFFAILSIFSLQVLAFEIQSDIKSDDVISLEQEFNLSEDGEDKDINPAESELFKRLKDILADEQLKAVHDRDEGENLEDLLSNNFYEKAEIIVVNKIVAKSQRMIIKVGEAAFFGNIKIYPMRCWKSPNIYEDNNKILLKLEEAGIEDEDKVIFQGWLFSNDISISAPEHPIYEVLAVKCLGNKVKY